MKTSKVVLPVISFHFSLLTFTWSNCSYYCYFFVL